MRALWEWEIAALAEVPHTEHNAATSALVLCIVVEFGKAFLTLGLFYKSFFTDIFTIPGNAINLTLLF